MGQSFGRAGEKKIKRQKAKGKMKKTPKNLALGSDFCLLPFAFCLFAF